MVPDHIDALVQLLRADPEVAALCDGHVYGGTAIPRAAVRRMPANAVVIAYSGGVGALGVGAQSWGDVRVDARSYGPSEQGAGVVFRAVYTALKGFERKVFADMLLHWARPVGGPLQLRDPDTDWPFILTSWQVLAGETPVSGG